MKAVVFYNLKLFQNSKMPSEKAVIKQQNKLDMLAQIMETAIENKADFIVGIGTFFANLPSFYSLSGVYSRLNSYIPIFIESQEKSPIKLPNNLLELTDLSGFLNENFKLKCSVQGHIFSILNENNKQVSCIEGGVEFLKEPNKIMIPQVFPCFCGTEKGGFITVEFNEDGSILSSKFNENSIRIIQISARDEDELKEKLKKVKPEWGVNLTIFNRLLAPSAAALLSDFFHYRITVEDEQLESLLTFKKSNDEDIKDEFLKMNMPFSIKKAGVAALENAINKKK